VRGVSPRQPSCGPLIPPRRRASSLCSLRARAGRRGGSGGLPPTTPSLARYCCRRAAAAAATPCDLRLAPPPALSLARFAAAGLFFGSASRSSSRGPSLCMRRLSLSHSHSLSLSLSLSSAQAIPRRASPSPTQLRGAGTSRGTRSRWWPGGSSRSGCSRRGTGRERRRLTAGSGATSSTRRYVNITPVERAHLSH
jgi:hypothetical protein